MGNRKPARPYSRNARAVEYKSQKIVPKHRLNKTITRNESAIMYHVQFTLMHLPILPGSGRQHLHNCGCDISIKSRYAEGEGERERDRETLLAIRSRRYMTVASVRCNLQFATSAKSLEVSCLLVTVCAHGGLGLRYTEFVFTVSYAIIICTIEFLVCVPSITNGLNSIGSWNGPLHNAVVDLSLTKDPDSTVFYVIRHTYVQYICAFNSRLTGRRNIGRPWSVSTNFLQMSRGIVDLNVTQHAYLGRVKKIDRGAANLPGSNFRKSATGERKSLMLGRSEKVASKSDVSCKDTKVTSEAICEALQGLDYSTTAKRAIWRTEFLLIKKVTSQCVIHNRFLFLLRDFRRFISGQTRRNHGDLIACFLFLAIALFKFLRLLPYNRMPKPRLFYANDEDAECIILPKRPSSPVRHILPGKFDLHAKTEELLKRRGIAKAGRYLWEFKDRISQSVKQIWDAGVDLDLVICMLVLQALCENVILTMADTDTGIDVHTFVNMAVSWTLVDLQILDPTMDEQERAMFAEMEFDIDRRPTSREMVVFSKLRRALFEVHRPKFDPHVSMHLHRSLPWSLVSPAHQTGVVKFYPNVRERIGEMVPDSSQYVKSVYVPDVTCFHFREMLEQAYMA
ncbi:hypothetical protein DBV15_10513 [Temnothorax longispinosus]|uniref:Uncharacterized protein n=1 Tax=Temnothorax longispinosus TaxID=300112 RepID=A0A4S2KRS3_9HYME|nr:hypothetical protein DBV15_10513 [Temnothorax longispinosus]